MTSTHGGANITPTPANNVGGGSGLGDSGFPKGGGTEGLGHVATEVPAETEGQFNSLQQQKDMAEAHYKDRLGGVQESSEFMKHKPGGDDTLPGWSKVKDVMFG